MHSEVVESKQTGGHAKNARETTKALRNSLSVRLGHTLELILFLDGVRVGRALGSVDELISETFSHRLDVTESTLASTNGDQADTLVYPSERADIDGLATDGSLATNTRRVFAGASVDNSIDEDLDRVLVGEEVDDLERMGNDPNGHELLSVVATFHHERIDKTLDDGHLCLFELLLGVSAGGMWDVDRVAGLDIVGQ